MSTEVLHPYVVSREDIAGGKPIITGTRTRVSTVIAYYRLGYSPEELAREFPHLTLSQIHDALSFYYEHREQIDKEIDEESEDNLKTLIHK